MCCMVQNAGKFAFTLPHIGYILVCDPLHVNLQFSLRHMPPYAIIFQTVGHQLQIYALYFLSHSIFPYLPLPVVTCLPLMDPINGQVSHESLEYLTTAVYSCNQGYSREGDATRTCLQTGQWSGEQPTCQRTYLHRNTLAIVYGC